MVLLIAVPSLVRRVRAGMGLSPGGPEPLTCAVTRGDFVHEILVKGEVESAIHTEVRCEVRAQRGQWVRILDVVPDGTHVEPGDLLVRLDSSILEADRNQQRIVCEQAFAEVAKAQSDYEAAETAQRNYLRGDYAMDRQVAELGLFVARDSRRRAGQSLEASRKLEALGYVTAQQLRANQFGLQAAETDVKMAETKLQVLDSCTKRRKLVQLQSAVAASKAQLAAAEAKYRVSCQQLAVIEDQIRKCTIRAPVSGCVVLAHLFHNNHAHMIEPGETVWERRVLLRLPDYRHMQIAAKIEEAKIALLRAGLPATIHLEGLPEAELSGKVVTISEYPDADDWVGSAVKQYRTAVAIDRPLARDAAGDDGRVADPRVPAGGPVAGPLAGRAAPRRQGLLHQRGRRSLRRRRSGARPVQRPDHRDPQRSGRAPAAGPQSRVVPREGLSARAEGTAASSPVRPKYAAMMGFEDRSSMSSKQSDAGRTDSRSTTAVRSPERAAA